jgi:hypothetical protein
VSQQLLSQTLQAESAAGAMYGGNSGHIIVCVEGGPSRRRSSYEMQPSSFDVTATTCALQKVDSSCGSSSSSSSSGGSKSASAARRKAFGSGSAVMSAWTAGTSSSSSSSMSAAAVAAAAAARQAAPVSFDPWSAAGTLQREHTTISHTV